MDKKDIKFVYDTLGFMDKLSREEAKLLLENTSTVKYRQGENIYSANNDCVGVMLVKSGELRTYILSEDGRDVTLYRLFAGDVCILSASCLLKNITFDVQIDAEADSDVLLVNPVLYSQLQSTNVYVENFSLKIAADRFSDVIWAMEQMLFMRFDRRLAIFLLDESSKTGSDDIKLTHEQIARYMGSAREVVSRMMKHFENSGMVTMYRGGVKITDKPQLKKLI